SRQASPGPTLLGDGRGNELGSTADWHEDHLVGACLRQSQMPLRAWPPQNQTQRVRTRFTMPTVAENRRAPLIRKISSGRNANSKSTSIAQRADTQDGAGAALKAC